MDPPHYLVIVTQEQIKVSERKTLIEYMMGINGVGINGVLI